MSDYKLVPVEPTPEMVEAAKDAYMPFGDMDMAIRMAILAAPAVQGEPVAYLRKDQLVHVRRMGPMLGEIADSPRVDRVSVYAAPQPDVTQLVKAAAAALDEIEAIMHEAYNSAYPVCCGRPGSECCGSPEPEWEETDQRMMDRLAPHQKALREALAAPQPAPDVACNQSRESSMVVLERDAEGKPTVWCDPEIADLVSTMNKAGIRTVASCSGHGHRPGNIMLADGRELVIARDFDEARKIDAMFPGINGDPPMVDVSALVEELGEALEAIVSHHDEYFEDSSTESKMPWIKQARAALAAYRKEGGEV